MLAAVIPGRLPALAMALTLVAIFSGCGMAAGLREDAADLPEVQNNWGPRGYKSLVNRSLRLMNEYWRKDLADRDVGYAPPEALVSYWNRRQDPRCAGERGGWENAMYCPASDTISWDGNWLWGDLYRNVGDAAVAFLLAHEYGHLVQQRLGIVNKFPLTIEGELNADCLAGAWLGDVDSNVQRLSTVDFDALDLGVLIVADPRGVPWQNPTAHGTASERRRALLLGGRGGSQSCLNRLGPGFST